MVTDFQFFSLADSLGICNKIVISYPYLNSVAALPGETSISEN